MKLVRMRKAHIGREEAEAILADYARAQFGDFGPEVSEPGIRWYEDGSLAIYFVESEEEAS